MRSMWNHTGRFALARNRTWRPCYIANLSRDNFSYSLANRSESDSSSRSEVSGPRVVQRGVWSLNPTLLGTTCLEQRAGGGRTNVGRLNRVTDLNGSCSLMSCFLCVCATSRFSIIFLGVGFLILDHCSLYLISQITPERYLTRGAPGGLRPHHVHSFFRLFYPVGYFLFLL